MGCLALAHRRLNPGRQPVNTHEVNQASKQSPHAVANHAFNELAIGHTVIAPISAEQHGCHYQSYQVCERCTSTSTNRPVR
eukprot:8579912-Alexandrium_andersonii.AAC.1